MKVFLISTNHDGMGGCDGYQVLVAAPSSGKAKAAGRQHGFQCGRRDAELPPDPEDVELALAQPGVVHWRPDDGTDGRWRSAAELRRA